MTWKGRRKIRNKQKKSKANNESIRENNVIETEEMTNSCQRIRCTNLNCSCQTVSLYICICPTVFQFSQCWTDVP